jgi:replicative DNA helicase
MEDIALERGMPASPDSERSILGAILLERKHLIEANAARLEVEDFSLDSHRRIFRAMLSLENRRQPIDLITLVEELAKRKEVDSVGGVAYVASLTEGLPRRVSIAEYVRIVKDKSIARQTIVLLNAGINAAVDQSEDAMELVGRTIADLRELSSLANADKIETAGEFFQRRYRNIDEFFSPKSRPEGLRFGINRIDRHLRLKPKELIIIAARPSQGKTALMGNMVWNICTAQGKKAAVFSLEQDKESLIQRLVAQASLTSLDEMIAPQHSFGMRDRVMQALEDMLGAKLFIDDERETTIEQIVAKAEGLHDEHGLDAMFLDYLTYIPSHRRKDERRDQEIGRHTKELRALAKRLNIPVVVLAQLKRPESRSDPRPRLSDLRESGDIEQDADIVAFIHREEKYNPTEENAGMADIDIAKQRNGWTGLVENLRYEGPHFRFHDGAN